MLINCVEHKKIGNLFYRYYYYTGLLGRTEHQLCFIMTVVKIATHTLLEFDKSLFCWDCFAGSELG